MRMRHFSKLSIQCQRPVGEVLQTVGRATGTDVSLPVQIHRAVMCTQDVSCKGSTQSCQAHKRLSCKWHQDFRGKWQILRASQ
jgi:hypothetical protein